MDQFEVSNLVNRYADLQSRMAEYKVYCNLSYEERNKFARENGKDRIQAPKIEELEEITEMAMKFMRKLVLSDEIKANIFDE